MSHYERNVSDSESVESESSKTSHQDNDRQVRWVREVLSKYLCKYVRDYMSNRRDFVPSPVSSNIDLSDGNGNNGSTSPSYVFSNVSKNEPRAHHSNASEPDASDMLNPIHNKTTELNKDQATLHKELMGLAVIDFDLVEETALGDDRITYLSRILSLGVNYNVTGHPEHFLQWIIKVPSRYFDERNIARVTNVHKREVSFYLDILQSIKLWLEHNSDSSSNDQRITLNVPTCYYAKSRDSDIDFDPEVYEFPNTEFTLVLEDLRAQGFGKRHFSNGLTPDEAREAIREIAKIHATCWAMQQHSNEQRLVWSELLGWEDLHLIYLDMIRQGYRHLHLFRRELRNPLHISLVDSLLELESNLSVLLEGLLKPLPPPAVTSLVHMDFWMENLLFKSASHDDPDDYESELHNEGESNESDSNNQNVDIDCMIVDWQMVSVGRITNDIGMLLMTSLDAETRRKNEKDLINFYCETFEKIVQMFKLDIPFNVSHLRKEYRQSCLLATLLSVSRLDLVVSEESTLKRFFDGLEDLKHHLII